VRRRFKLYYSQEEHSADCAKFPFNQIPCRVFLDTNIVNCLVKWSCCVFEMEEPPSNLDSTLLSDIESLMHVFQVGRRADWDIIASDKVIEELSQTKDGTLRNELLDYGIDLTGYSAFRGVDDDHEHAHDLARRLRDSSFVSALPDINDRDLIAHAVAFRCDAFCTRDRRSIHNKRDTLRSLPIKILTPAEWWQYIKPWAGLWC
jgi:hypothetical protein